MSDLIMPDPAGVTLACRFGRHRWEKIEAIRDLDGSPWLMDDEFETNGRSCQVVSVRATARRRRVPDRVPV
jgi:hypothetical protein